MSKRILTIVIVFLFLILKIKPTHNKAGEIIYKRIQPTATLVNGVYVPIFKFEFIIRTYTEINSPGGNADRCKLTLHLGNGDSLVLPRTNGPAGPTSGDCAGTFSGQVINPTTKYNEYKGVYQYANPGIYKVYVYDPNRNEGVVNIPNSVDQPFYLESLLVIDNFVGSNTSPILTSPPLDQACLGICFYHNPGAYDPDGDSLSFELTYCRGVDQLGNIGQPIPGYTYPATGPGGSFSIHPTTGLLKWCVPQSPTGEYNIAFIVKEWRKYGNQRVLIGYVLRDMQVKVLQCSTNLPPFIKPISDTCVVAGNPVIKNFEVSDPNNGNIVLIYGLGGTFTDVNPKATLSFTSAQFIAPNTSTICTYTWSTQCSYIRNQPYQVLIKAEDQQLPVKLTYFESFFIKVVPPPIPGLTVNPSGVYMNLNWQPAPCNPPNNPIVGYIIHRKEDCIPFNYDPCNVTKPSFYGFQAIDTVPPSVLSFTDTNNGMGLVIGQDYSYVVQALYLDGSISHAGNPVCQRLKLDVPVLLNVDVMSTSASGGSVFVRWSKPKTNAGNFDTLANPGPYQFLLFHRLSSTGNYTLIHTITKNQFYQFNTLQDTSYIHSNLNTESQQHQYRVAFVASTGTIGFSSPAKSIFLSTTGSDRKIILNWNVQVPWKNNLYRIYRKNPSQTAYTLHATVPGSVTSYVDSTLIVNKFVYCYYVESSGAYSYSAFPSPLINRSQESCARALDNVPPCSPTISANADCIQGNLQLNWMIPNSHCAADITKYILLKKETESEPFQLIDTLYGKGTLSYSFSDLDDIVGCYAVRAIDSSLNVSPLVDSICIENCPEFELPNIFTANGDGVNDFFKAIKVRQIKKIHLTVFDRWGVKVFETEDPYFRWDGTSIVTKRKVADGTLFYVCEVYEKRLKGIRKRVLKGYVQVVN
ncbi:MAG: gliding motility-associated C-terminal domain-containing protein [Bacteroidia bacterium]|nr:gliding motility-associated C-terminal domain-containing protein [Bacteroidia bacterium]